MADKAPVSEKKVRVCVPNVWASNAKFFNEDIVVLPTQEADLLVANKQAKPTRDSATVTIEDRKKVF